MYGFIGCKGFGVAARVDQLVRPGDRHDRGPFGFVPPSGDVSKEIPGSDPILLLFRFRLDER